MKTISLIVLLLILLALAVPVLAYDPVPPDPILPGCRNGAQWNDPPTPLDMTYHINDEYARICQVSIFESGTLTNYIEDAAGITGLNTHTIHVDNPGEIIYIYAAGPYPYRLYIPIANNN